MFRHDRSSGFIRGYHQLAPTDTYVNETEGGKEEKEGKEKEKEKEAMTHLDFYPSVFLNYILNIRIPAFALLRIPLLSCYGIERNHSLYQVGS